DCAMVLPRVIVVLVIPTSVCGALPAEPPHAAKVKSNAVTAASRGKFRPIEIPPISVDPYSNSLGIRRHLSTLPITRPAEPAVQRGVTPRQQSDDAVRRKDHDQDQDYAVRYSRTGVLDGRSDLIGQPGLAWDPLARSNRQEVGEDRAQQGAGNGRQPADDRSDQELNRKADREGVRADVADAQAEQRTRDPGIERRDAESQRLVARDVDARRRRGHLGVADRAHGAARTVADEVPRHPEQY